MLKEQGLDPTKTSLPRCELWMAGRKSYNDMYDEDVMDVVRNIGSLKEQVSQGQLSPEGREDILALALGKEEHSGRVRGVGAGVGLKNYFSDSRGKISSNASEKRFNELQAQMEVLQQENASRDQLLEELKSQLDFFQKKLGADAFMPNVVVPFPNEEVTHVLQAKDTHVVWPKELVVIKSQNQNSGYAKNQKQMDGNTHQRQYATTSGGSRNK